MLTRRSRYHRLAIAILSGGCLLQIGSCAASLVPVFESFAESTILQLILGTLLPN